MQNKELYDIITANDMIINDTMMENSKNIDNKFFDFFTFVIEDYKGCDKRLIELYEKQLVIIKKLKNNIYPGLDEYVEYCFSPILLNSYEF